MIEQQILQPVIALAIWTMIMWAWMYATRIPAMSNSDDIDTANLTGGTGTDLDKLLPDRVQWKAHNYNHLHEQPTIFYAVALTLAVMGHGDGQSALLAWIYVGLRVAHSLVQVTANKVMARFVLFALSSLVLIVLIFKAARVAFGF
jgi:hypothetical protein